MYTSSMLHRCHLCSRRRVPLEMHYSWWTLRSVVRGCMHLLAALLYAFSGYLSTRPPPLNRFPSALSNALQMFENLSSFTLIPSTSHEDIFVQSFSVLKNTVHLTELAVNLACMNDSTVPMLTELERIRNLTLYGPGRTILNLLPDWLRRLSKTLTGLHLKVS